jgi:transposase
MSTSLLYHAFGVRGYQYTRTDYHDGQTIFTIRQEPETCRCSACGSPKVQSRGQVERRFRTVPIGSRVTSVVLPIPRVECQACGLVRQVKVPFADPRRGYTKAFERYALELGRRMTIRDVSVHLDVSWDLIKEIQRRDLTRRYSKPKLKHLRHIAIDEIAVAKGHRYLTVVLDLDSGAVVFVGDGKGAKALVPFWRRLRGSKAKIEAVAMDMSPAYREAVSTNLPGAKIVFDRFHVMKLFNEKLSDLRRALHREATDAMQKRVLKGTRWLLLKASENLDEERDEKAKLEEALSLNKSLATAYYLKEDLRQFREQPGKRFATLFLDGWIKRAEASGIKILQQMARTLAAHRGGLLAYSDVMITSGPMEGTNHKIKTMKRQAYGFRDKEFFKLKILAIHETRYELVGKCDIDTMAGCAQVPDEPQNSGSLPLLGLRQE